jgi:hypothetical protein
VAAAHAHSTAENMELTVPRLERLVRESMESSGVVLCKVRACNPYPRVC